MRIPLLSQIDDFLVVRSPELWTLGFHYLLVGSLVGSMVASALGTAWRGTTDANLEPFVLVLMLALGGIGVRWCFVQARQRRSGFGNGFLAVWRLAPAYMVALLLIMAPSIAFLVATNEVARWDDELVPVTLLVSTAAMATWCTRGISLVRLAVGVGAGLAAIIVITALTSVLRSDGSILRELILVGHGSCAVCAYIRFSRARPYLAAIAIAAIPVSLLALIDLLSSSGSRDSWIHIFLMIALTPVAAIPFTPLLRAIRTLPDET